MNKQQIAEELKQKHQDFVDFVINLPEADFTFTPENKWTAGQKLDHILRSVSPLKNALSLPKFVPKVLFGKANRKSISYDDLVAKYQGKLADGGKASGRFIPPAISFEKRESLKNKLLKTVADLAEKIERLSENELDEYLLPHPILGKLTVREMLYFTIYHVEHHHKAILRNLEK